MQPGEIEFVAPHPDRGVSGSAGEQKPPGPGVRWLVWGLAIAVAVAVTAVWLGNRPQPVTPVGAPVPIPSLAVASPVGESVAPPVTVGAATTKPLTGCVATLMKRLFAMADAYRRTRAAGHSVASAERAARDHLATVLSPGTRRYGVTLGSWTTNRSTLVRGSGRLDLTGACGRAAPPSVMTAVGPGAQTGRTG